MRRVRKPIIAAVNGAAAGGGLAFALASDIRVCSESAKFNVAFVKIGLSGCDVGVSYLLPRLIGASQGVRDDAHRTLSCSRTRPTASGSSPASCRTVRRVDAALEIADQIIANSPFGVWMTKEVMWSNLETGSMQAAIDLENRTQLLCGSSPDSREAIMAFMEKRPPQFSGRG